MRTRFVFESTMKQFNEMLEQAVLVQYILEHRRNLFCAVAAGIAFLLAGVYAFCRSAELVGVLCVVLGCVVGSLLTWMEETGQRVKRELTKLRKTNSSDDTQHVFRVEVEDECLRVIAVEAELANSAYRLNTLRSVFETEQAFLLNFEDGNGYILPKGAFWEGTSDEFREYLCARTKNYRFYQFTEKMKSFMK